MGQGCNVRAGLAVCTAVVLDGFAKLLLHHAALVTQGRLPAQLWWGTPSPSERAADQNPATCHI